MKPDGDSPPFWTQSPTFFHRQPPSPIINPVALILLIPILALLVLFFLLPPFFSHASQFLRPNSVKKSWDSITVLLVIFAILCGIFARKNDDISGSRSEDVAREGRGNVGPGFEYSDPKVYSSDPVAVTGTGISRLRRSSSSYPDLRQVSAWEMKDNRFRFYDDFEVNFYRSTAAEYDRHRPRWSEAERKEDEVKVIPVDTVKVRSSPTATASPAPIPPPPPPPSQKKLKRRRSLNTVPRNMQSDETAAVFVEKMPPPPPPPPPVPAAVREQIPAEKPPKLQRKKSGAGNEIATAIASFYNQIKRKQRTKTINIYETAPTAEHSPSSAHSPIPPQTPPPPPPPPPPSKVFHNLFKKSSKSKRVHSVSSNAPPPPPPPPPPKSILNNLFKTGGKSKRFHHQPTSNPPPPPPPLPPRSSIVNSFLKTENISSRFNFKSPNYASAPSPPSYYHQTSNQYPSTARNPPLTAKTPSGYYDENLNSGSQSPLIPAPPPPLPFRMPEMSFVLRGDFVRILSNHSSQCSSPELEDVDVMSVKSEQIDGDDVIGSSVCPSPDVNIKAETFIVGLRDKWRMEKINSLRTCQGPM